MINTVKKILSLLKIGKTVKHIEKELGLENENGLQSYLYRKNLNVPYVAPPKKK